MNVAGRSEYYNNIYRAIVVNVDTSQDPENKDRFQIYIPTIHYEYDGEYQNYMEDSNKTGNPNFNVFPWAVTLVDNLKLGDIVYGSNIDNKNDSYIILGVDVMAMKNGNGDGNYDLDFDITTTGILGMAMPIIIQNETGVDASKYPWDIPDSYFKTITSYDGKKR